MTNSGGSGGGGSGSGSTHILICPFPALGHMIPFLDFTHQLAIRNLTITILITPKNLPLLGPILSRHPSTIHTLILPFPKHPLIPEGVENVKDLPANAFRSMMCAMGGLYGPLLHWFKSNPSPPIAIISDFFLGWTHRLASELGIPRIVFSPSGAMAVAVIDSLWRHLPMNDDPNFMFTFKNLPNSPIYPWWQLSPVYRSYKQEDPESEFVKDGMRGNVASWGIVINSFNELESVYLESLRKGGYNGRVWAVGPLLPAAYGSTTTVRELSVTVDRTDLLLWLDTCPDRSVIYICFGSQAVLTNIQMEALANGIEQSGARFVWCYKGATTVHVAGDYGVIPVGFEDRTAGRGLVIRGWVPQLSVLNHRSVGVFFTHCGWNSVLEGLSAGVAMVAWPMGADQFTDATLLVDHLGVAVKVCEGAEAVPDSDELSRVLAESVSENRCRKQRAVSDKMRELALGAVKEGGSSFMDLDGLVKELNKLSVER